jgi:ADP-ribose pyrophosphatase YjhB (NUDIX family)
MPNPKWLEWAQHMQSIAQAGLTYSQNPYDLERYKSLRELAAEILAEYTHTDLPVIEKLFESQTGYLTPKIDVRGVVFVDGKILLVKELADGFWTLPGGWVDVNEPPSRSVEREMWEETGYQVRSTKVLAVYDRNLHGHTVQSFHAYKLFIRCEIMGGQPSDSIETSGASFFSEDSIPPLSIDRVTMDEIQRMFAHHRNPDWPTDFD